jgi:hypothetical protein
VGIGPGAGFFSDILCVQLFKVLKSFQKFRKSEYEASNLKKTTK